MEKTVKIINEQKEAEVEKTARQRVGNEIPACIFHAALKSIALLSPHWSSRRSPHSVMLLQV